MRRMQVASIHVDRFAGWRNGDLAFPDAPFIVCIGENETGKSTVAELLTWLLVGTAGATTPRPDRFGEPDSVVGGRVRGTLDGRDFLATGSFRIPRSSVVRDAELHVEHGELLDAAGWRAKLGGIDLSMVRAVYRLSGVDLHLGDDVSRQLSRLALGGFGRRVDVRGIARQLAERGTIASTTTAKGVDSVRSLSGDIEALDLQIREADNNADVVAVVDAELTRIVSERTIARGRAAAVARSRTIVERALEATAQRLALQQAEFACRAARQPEAAWTGVSANIVALDHALSAASQAESLAGTAAEAVDRCACALGIERETLASVVVTDADLQSVARGVAALGAVDEDATAMAASLPRLARELEACTAEVERMLVTLGSVDREQVRSAEHDPAAHGAIRAALAAWTQSTAELDTATRRISDAELAVSIAEADRRSATAVWDTWGTGVDAHEWQGAGGSGPTASPGGPWRLVASWMPWLPVTILVVVTLTAIAFRQPVVAGIALVATVVLLVLASAGQTIRSSTAVPSEQLLVASRSVITASSRYHDAARDLQTAHIVADDARRRLDATESEYRSVALRLGHRVVERPELVVPTLSAWAAAAQLLDREAKCREGFELAGRRLADIGERVESAGATIRQLLASFGVPPPQDFHSAGEAAIQFRRAALLHHEWTTADSVAHERRRHVGTWLSDVADEIDGWPDAMVLERAQLTASIVATNRSLETRRVLAQHAYDSAVGDHPMVVALLTRTDSVAELEQLRAVAIDDEAEATAVVQARSEDAGRAQRRLDELEQVDVLAGRIEARGRLAEQREQLAFEACALRAAATLLDRVSDGFERENQPALIARASELARDAAPEWDGMVLRAEQGGSTARLHLRFHDGRVVPASRLSTGAQALVYLSLRIAMAGQDGNDRGIAFPLICDDPLVHLDDVRAGRAAALLAGAAAHRQVMLFTCHGRTVEAAKRHGAVVIELGQ